MSTQPATLHDVQPDGFFTRGLADADPAVFAGVAHELDRDARAPAGLGRTSERRRGFTKAGPPGRTFRGGQP